MPAESGNAELIAALNEGLFKKSFGQKLGGLTDEALLSKLRGGVPKDLSGYEDLLNVILKNKGKGKEAAKAIKAIEAMAAAGPSASAAGAAASSAGATVAETVAAASGEEVGRKAAWDAWEGMGKNIGGTAKSMPLPEDSYRALFKNKDIKGLLKKPGTQMGLLFLAQMLAGRLIGEGEEYERMGMQQEAIKNQMNMSPDEAYYQAALPDLMEERKTAQMALMQSILGGDAGIQVPGERRI